MAHESMVDLQGKAGSAIEDPLSGRAAPADHDVSSAEPVDAPGLRELLEEAGTESADGSTVGEIEALLAEADLDFDPVPPHRLYWEVREFNDYDKGHIEQVVPSKRGTADVVSSKTISGNHAPAIDLDLPCRLIESGTPGHFHLYIDAEIEFGKYMKLLEVMAEVGLVEPGYVKMSKERGMSYLRVPNKPKGSPQAKPFLSEKKAKQTGISSY